MNFEYNGFKFGISSHAGEFFFYSQKMIDRKKPQQRLKSKSLKAAIKEVKDIIDSKK